MAAEIKLKGVSIDHPGAAEQTRGEESRVSLSVTVGKSDQIRSIPLGEDELVVLIRDSAKMLAILKGVGR